MPTFDPIRREAALRAVVAAFVADNPHAQRLAASVLSETAARTEAGDDPVASALAAVGSMTADLEMLAGYVKFAAERAGGLAGLSDLAASVEDDGLYGVHLSRLVALRDAAKRLYSGALSKREQTEIASEIMAVVTNVVPIDY